MAPPHAISISTELDVRESSEPGPLALLGPGNHAAPDPSGCTETRNREANRLAYFSPHVFDAASEYGRRTENHARVVASLHDSRNLDTYTQAVTAEKRNAQDAVVALLFPPKMEEKPDAA